MPIVGSGIGAQRRLCPLSLFAVTSAAVAQTRREYHHVRRTLKQLSVEELMMSR